MAAPAGRDEIQQALVGQVVTEIANIGASVFGLDAATKSLSGLAERASDKATNVVAVSGEVSATMGTVAGAVEEMSSSLRGVADGTATAATTVQQVLQNAEQARHTVADLDSSSQAIRQVSQAIARVARQTNLLALNATIEAARAGEAGKGFAVVAGEVKDLSKQTEQATQQIDASVQQLVADVERALAAIAEIAAGMGRIDSMTSEVASAVAEQTTVTADMARHITEAAAGSEKVALEISDVTAAIADTQQGVRQVERISRRMYGGARALDESVHGLFSGQVRDQRVTGHGTAGQLRAGIQAHGAWKARLLEAVITGGSAFDPAVVALDNRCPLGTWLHDQAGAHERSSAWYGEVRALHTKFHTLAGRILAQATGGQQGQALRAIEFDGEFDHLSAELIGQLNDWCEEVDGT